MAIYDDIQQKKNNYYSVDYKNDVIYADIRDRIPHSPQKGMQLVAQATGCFWIQARRKLAFVRVWSRKQ